MKGIHETEIVARNRRSLDVEHTCFERGRGVWKVTAAYWSMDAIWCYSKSVDKQVLFVSGSVEASFSFATLASIAATYGIIMYYSIYISNSIVKKSCNQSHSCVDPLTVWGKVFRVDSARIGAPESIPDLANLALTRWLLKTVLCEAASLSFAAWDHAVLRNCVICWCIIFCWGGSLVPSACLSVCGFLFRSFMFIHVWVVQPTLDFAAGTFCLKRRMQDWKPLIISQASNACFRVHLWGSSSVAIACNSRVI